ncbi:hypothetical protein BB559_007334 [Furculomyces boomerangus]|uniref:non-specific serine/threonine protein kinase n=1 Tax=Furculomyces boomerangus TaxID=61424 RepID=A0A2T9XXR9_9FUNG|nr:hypothetical protein BB559_007334 [Furculomyces boomerangus]
MLKVHNYKHTTQINTNTKCPPLDTLNSKSGFVFGKCLGSGSYSTIVEARAKNSGTLYAAKIMNKNHIIKSKKLKYPEVERTALLRLDNHFIVKLASAFQDTENIFFILSYEENGDLFSLIEKNGVLSKQLAQFYAAELLLAIEFIHKNNILHRDIKPENILLDKDMHIKLSDFGSAKILDGNKEDHMNKTESTICDRKNIVSFTGTIEFIPPEILKGNQPEKGTDIWAFGCTIYQMLMGKPLFKDQNDLFTFQKVLNIEYELPSSLDLDAKDIISKIIVEIPEERLGCKKELELKEIKDHTFFKGISWIPLGMKQIQPPISDVSHTFSVPYTACNEKESDFIEPSDKFCFEQILRQNTRVANDSDISNNEPIDTEFESNSFPEIFHPDHFRKFVLTKNSFNTECSARTFIEPKGDFCFESLEQILSTKNESPQKTAFPDIEIGKFESDLHFNDSTLTNSKRISHIVQAELDKNLSQKDYEDINAKTIDVKKRKSPKIECMFTGGDSNEEKNPKASSKKDEYSCTAPVIKPLTINTSSFVVSDEKTGDFKTKTMKEKLFGRIGRCLCF